ARILFILIHWQALKLALVGAIADDDEIGTPVSQLLRPVLLVEIVREQPNEGAVDSERIVLNSPAAGFKRDAEDSNFTVARRLQGHPVGTLRNADFMKRRLHRLAVGGDSSVVYSINLNFEIAATGLSEEIDIEGRHQTAHLTILRCPKTRRGAR